MLRATASTKCCCRRRPAHAEARQHPWSTSPGNHGKTLPEFYLCCSLLRVNVKLAMVQRAPSWSDTSLCKSLRTLARIHAKFLRLHCRWSHLRPAGPWDMHQRCFMPHTLPVSSSGFTRAMLAAFSSRTAPALPATRWPACCCVARCSGRPRQAGSDQSVRLVHNTCFSLIPAMNSTACSPPSALSPEPSIPSLCAFFSKPFTFDYIINVWARLNLTLSYPG